MGFLLPPGSASTWLTAHVAFVVDRVADLDDACWRAAHFLAKVGADDGGWGYNRRVSVDCDSSAQALIVLDRFGIRAEEFLVEALAKSQLPCGGFPTYPSEDPASPPATGWHAAHADVSVLVAEALRRRGGFDERVQRCATWVEQQLTNGVLPSYWWPGPYYGLWVQAKVGRLPRAAAAITRTALQSSATQPQMGMALSAAIRAGLSDEQITPFVGALLKGQSADGSWACGPCLRVSSPREFVATEHVSGPVFADRRRILSTAHAVAALASALQAS